MDKASLEAAQAHRNRVGSERIHAEQQAVRATAPIDLLREFRAGFKAEAEHFRKRSMVTPDPGEEQAAGAKAFAAEQAVKRIDATLRDWT